MEQLFKFSLKFDNDDNSVNKLNGLSMRELCDLLKLLDEATDPKDGSFLALTDISDNCQKPILKTNSLVWHDNLKSIHYNITERGLSNLPDTQSKYGRALKNYLKDRNITSLEPIDNTDNPFVKIYQSNIVNDVKHYSEIGTVRGIITRMGGKKLQGKTHIDLEGVDYAIFTDAIQDKDLKPYYREGVINFRVIKKISIASKKAISAKLINYQPLKAGDFLTNIKNLPESDFSVFKAVKTEADITNVYK